MFDELMVGGFVKGGWAALLDWVLELDDTIRTAHFHSGYQVIGIVLIFPQGMEDAVVRLGVALAILIIDVLPLDQSSRTFERAGQPKSSQGGECRKDDGAQHFVLRLAE